ncbi:MAG: indole-3-glycerol phosphate synthase [Acidimicrobiia bacterium]|nr:MAG: indole-3-glycerol phosphate synthase [Acidimicrobiia bacterium]
MRAASGPIPGLRPVPAVQFRALGILETILATKRDEVTVLRHPQTRDLLRRRALEAPPVRDFAGALRRADGGLAVIGELKRRSPSKGDLAPDLDAAATAKSYEAGGAAALSVLTDGPHFGGSVADLDDARSATSIPVLRKDFTIDEIQVYEARAIGADALLLIVAALPDDALLSDLHALATELGLGVLVEAHGEPEIERALRAGARIVGVNSRDLSTFAEDLGIAEAGAVSIPGDVIAVAESAVRGVEDAARMAAAGFDAVLVGEALVRSEDPSALVRAMAARSVRRRGGE